MTEPPLPSDKVRVFATGATRDTNLGKFDYEGFLSPLVLQRFGAYMHQHRHQSDGKLRDSDNWQKGIPLEEYIKSLLRHVIDLWLAHRGWAEEFNKEDLLCAILFNTQGYLHEYLKGSKVGWTEFDDSPLTAEKMRKTVQMLGWSPKNGD